jgi:hypothetical protein
LQVTCAEEELDYSYSYPVNEEFLGEKYFFWLSDFPREGCVLTRHRLPYFHEELANVENPVQTVVHNDNDTNMLIR